MDRITKSLLDSFLEEQGIRGLDESRCLELFVNHCVAYRECGSDVTAHDITLGENEVGIDGLAIVVNGHLVSSREEVDDIVRSDKQLRVKFVFVQAKTSPSFEGSEIGTFAFAVSDFFSAVPKLTRSRAISELAEVQNHIYENSRYMLHSRPVCRMFFVTTGKWTDDQNLSARLDSGKADLQQTDLFDRVDFDPIDARRLQRLYSATQTSISVEIQFPTCVTVPPLEGVPESYIGTLSSDEFMKLIVDESDNLRRSLFYENVRDFQGENLVNQGISETLKSPSQDRFVLLNNGVTIVAKALHKVGTRFRLEDFQIVNGCQTSHVLYMNREALRPTLLVPTKLIVTDSEEVMTAVIKATNSQTEVKNEQLQALSEFQKQLEDFYSTFQGDAKLYYERRSNQYAQVPGVEKVRIISIANQMRAFASMFLGEPHRAYRYYGTLHREIGERLFSETHRHMPYYTSAYALYRLEALLRNGTVPREYRPYRYHLLFAFKTLVAGTKTPRFSAKALDTYCGRINRVLWDTENIDTAFNPAAEVIHQVLQQYGDDGRDAAKTQAFTDSVLRLSESRLSDA